MSETALTYSWKFAVRTYELDPHRHIKLTSLLNYMEESATQASATFGFDYAWYRAHQRLWVARKHTIRFHAPLTYPDEVVARTWISDMRRVQSHREYRFTHSSNGAPILSARTNWVFINETTLKPERIPAELERFIIASEQGLEKLDTAIREPIPVNSPRSHTELRRAEWEELDSAGHINNAVYVAWAEEAIRNLLRAADWDADRFARAEFVMHPHAHETEYLTSARYDDPIQVSVHLSDIGQDRAAWRTEIRHAGTEEVLCRDVCVRRFTDKNGPRSIPDDMLLALRDA